VLEGWPGRYSRATGGRPAATARADAGLASEVSRRRAKAAKQFFRKPLKSLTYVPRAIATDKLRSYAAAKPEILPDVEHRQSC
jgi:hypothetical protein